MKKNDTNVSYGNKFFLRIMKVYILLFFATMANLFATEANGQNITINFNDVELKTIFEEIENKTSFNFFYNNTLVDVSKKVSLNVENKELNAVLNKLLRKTKIDYRFFKNQIVLFPKNNTSVGAMIDEILVENENVDKEEVIENVKSKINIAIQNLISGTVSDETGPLPGVSVIIKGTSKGTETDFDGKYSIDANVGDVLQFSFVGMTTVERTVRQANTINIILEADNILDEVVVIAFGTTTKEAFTGSASVITAKQLESRSVTSPIAAIEGRATGVQFTSGTGGPGASPNIIIRGVGTLQGGTAPLYIVDGMQYDGALNTINQDDIASFTILKDAASTSLYGNRAANGVVIITTKKGSNNGEVKVNFSAQVGVVTAGIPFYDEVTPGEYYETMWEALKNSSAGGGDPAFASANIYNSLGYNPFDVPNDQIVGTDGQLNPNANVIYKSLDWYDTLQRSGIRNNYSVSVAGGSDKSKVFFSASYLEEESYVIKSKFDRLTTRINADFEVNDWIKMGGSANITITESTAPSSAGSGSIVNPFGFAKNIGSIYPVYVNDLDGNLVLDAAGKPVFDSGEGFSEFNIGSRPISQGRHALQELLLNDEGDRDNTYGFRYYADFKIIDGLNFRVNYGRDINEAIEKEYENNIIGDAQPTGRYSETRFRREIENFTQLLTYNKSFNDRHNFDITLGHESVDRSFSDIDALATEQVAEGIFEFDNFSSIVRLGGSTTEYGLEGYFARLNYNFDNKYYLSASARRDGSSVFSKDVRWGNFYSVGASWRIDQEEFMADVSFIDRLKLRVSYGAVGNDAIGNPRDRFASQARYSLTSNNTSPAIWWSFLGNNNLLWEALSSYDVALEFSLFNNFLDGSLEYYKKNSTDLLFNLPIALSNGFDEFSTNLGDMYNEGVELGVTAHLYKQKDFNWDLTLQASTFKNEITKIENPVINGSKRWAKGVSRYEFYLLHSAGVDPANGDALFFMYELDADGNSIPVLGADGNQETTNDWEETERAYTGANTIPDLIGSVSNSFRYKGFSLDVLLTYGIGGKVLDNAYSAMMHTGNFGRSYHPDILNAWRAPGDITSVPRLETGSNDQVLTQSTRFLTDASFWSLKNVSLGYTLNNNISDKIGVDNLRLSVTGENLYLKTKRSGLNPQFGLAGTSAGNSFNPSRIVSLGLNVSF